MITDIAVPLDWNVAIGFDNPFSFTFTENGAAFDISGYSHTIQGRKKGSTTAIFEITPTNGGTLGTLSGSLPKTQSELLTRGEFFWEMRSIHPNGKLYRWYKGALNATRELSSESGLTSVTQTINLGASTVEATISLGASSDHYRGVYTTISALQTAVPTGNPGDYADVDAGIGTDIQRYIWDDDDADWILGGGSGSTTTDATLSGDGTVGSPLSARHAIEAKVDNYTLQATDTFHTVEMNAATAKAVTVPELVFQDGDQVSIAWYGAGAVSVTAGTNVTILLPGGNSLSGGQSVVISGGRYNWAMLFARSSTEFYLLNGGNDYLNQIGALSPAAGDILQYSGSAWVLKSNVDTIQFVIDGGGTTITTGIKGDAYVKRNCTVTGWTVMADQSGAIVVDVWNQTYASYPPTVTQTITGSEKPTITASGVKGQDLTLTTWTTTALVAGTTLRFNVDSVTSITRATIVIHVLLN